MEMIVVVAQRFCSPACRQAGVLVFCVCQRTLFVVCKRSEGKNVCKYVRPLKYHSPSISGLTNFAHKLEARNHQQKTLVVARFERLLTAKSPAR